MNKSKMVDYSVSLLGGQYQDVWYNETVRASTKLGLTRQVSALRKKHSEYWDNWQGWHKPTALVMLANEPKTDFDDIDAIMPENDIPSEGNEASSHYSMAKYAIFGDDRDGIYYSTAAKKKLEEQ
jgi:hypothetical protein